MKKSVLLSLSVLFMIFLLAFNKETPDVYTYIQPGTQRSGDSAKGYEYLITGDFLSSGFPYKYFIMARGRDTNNYLGRTGKNATVGVGYNVIAGPDSIDMVIPTCLQCHAQLFDGKLIVGLGNTYVDFRYPPDMKTLNAGINMIRLTAPKQYRASKAFFESFRSVTPLLVTEARGVNPADALAAILAAHRDPQTLAWVDEPQITLPSQMVATDVPAWWLLKKKNAMFYTGFGRGDFAKFLMASNMLTVTDTAEANSVNSHFGDVLAYIRSIQPPKYPKPINEQLAAKGKQVFDDNCSKCHGTYGDGSTYPNLLIPGDVIQTDSLLFNANQQNPQFSEWFNKSWFSQLPYVAHIEASNGYVAPPLDGVWITAPYFHNGSVPTIETVLNSKLRPKYWTRNFTAPEYDYDKLGWKYVSLDTPSGKSAYNTSLQGYGNYGHYFGDVLTDKERKAVIEYIKTL